MTANGDDYLRSTGVGDLTSESEVSSSASVGAMSSLFLWPGGWAPSGVGPSRLPLARNWVLTANFLSPSGESAESAYKGHMVTEKSPNRMLIIQIYSTIVGFNLDALQQSLVEAPGTFRKGVQLPGLRIKRATHGLVMTGRVGRAGQLLKSSTTFSAKPRRCSNTTKSLQLTAALAAEAKGSMLMFSKCTMFTIRVQCEGIVKTIKTICQSDGRLSNYPQ
ncbi:hypothetical protein EYF80_003920 [Liparis tanakae]|uniref:Uncharacterized protein n=1 Tax=Liparis tanakae TaxID=230148 RepID=A0A4Z2J7S4_9TELE|nr:hypothetical protein EYF80_003920 [Liparis tanakae]